MSIVWLFASVQDYRDYIKIVPSNGPSDGANEERQLDGNAIPTNGLFGAFTPSWKSVHLQANGRYRDIKPIVKRILIMPEIYKVLQRALTHLFST